jgi:hypothetical protein
VCGKCLIHYSNIAACDYAAPQSKGKQRRPINVTLTSQSGICNPTVLPPTSQATCSASCSTSDQAQETVSSSGSQRSINSLEDAETSKAHSDCPCQFSRKLTSLAAYQNGF